MPRCGARPSHEAATRSAAPIRGIPPERPAPTGPPPGTDRPVAGLRWVRSHRLLRPSLRPHLTAGGEPAEREEEPARRVPGEHLAGEVSEERREQRARLPAELPVARPPGGPERGADETHQADQSHQAGLPEDLEHEVVRHVVVTEEAV